MSRRPRSRIPAAVAAARGRLALLAFAALAVEGAAPARPEPARPGVGPLALTLAGNVSVPEAPLPELPKLLLHGLNTNEDLAIAPFDAEGAPRPEAFAALRRFFRSSGDDEIDLDPRLVKLLVDLSAAYENRPVVLVSGHRRPGRGTSRGSYHVRGMAADVAIQGVPARDLRETAIRLGARGAGLYPSFVHVDVRETPYRWVGGGPRRRRAPARAPSIAADPYEDG